MNAEENKNYKRLKKVSVLWKRKITSKKIRITKVIKRRNCICIMRKKNCIIFPLLQVASKRMKSRIKK